MTEDSENLSDTKPAHASLGLVDRVGYDPTTEAYHTLHDWTDDSSLSVTIVEALATMTGVKPTEMKPLHPVIDLDALDTVLSSGEETDVRVEFAYEERSVTVRGTGEVIVR